MRYLFLFAVVIACSIGRPLQGDSQWQTLTPCVHQRQLRFQLPGSIETATDGQVEFWKSQADGNRYWVGIKPRKCSQGKAPLKSCDIAPLVRLAVPLGATFVSQKTTPEGYRHALLKNDPFFYYLSICFNDHTIAVLCTKTQETESPSHEKLIQSFAFLD